jgi:phosphoglycerate dehydrogenase-like enzyme
LADLHAREIGTVLATVVYEPDEIDQLRKAFSPAEFLHVHPLDNDAIAEGLERADVAVHAFDVDERFLAAPRLQWVHCDQAGLNRSARPEVFEKQLIVTGSAGRSAQALAQHAFYFALALTFDAKGLFEAQAAHRWGGIPDYEHRLALWGKTLGIVGLGHTGQATAALGKAFGMRVVAYRRRPGEVPATVDLLLASHDAGALDQLIEQSDVIVLAAPLTDATYHLFSAAQFCLMKRDALIVNMARGPLIDHIALADSLEAGEIAGAGLDVTEPEPLPPDSPLWDMRNVLITPHMTPKLPDRTQRSIDIIVENVGRYRRGEPMLNSLTALDTFTGVP